MEQGGDLTNLNINCPGIRDITYNEIPLQKVGDYWGFDTRSVTVQYTETIAVFKMSSEVIKCPTIGAASKITVEDWCSVSGSHISRQKQFSQEVGSYTCKEIITFMHHSVLFNRAATTA